jgi:hypothetical protein
MNLQNKVRTLLVLLVLLFLINIALIAYIYKESHQQQRKDEPRREALVTNEDPIAGYLKNEIHFSEEQLQAYEKDKEMHLQKMKQLRMEMRFRQRDYIALLVKDSISENEKQESLKEITSQYKNTQLEVFRHFSQIKDIATDQQHQKMSQRFHQVLWEALFTPKR